MRAWDCKGVGSASKASLQLHKGRALYGMRMSTKARRLKGHVHYCGSQVCCGRRSPFQPHFNDIQQGEASVPCPNPCIQPAVPFQSWMAMPGIGPGTQRRSITTQPLPFPCSSCSLDRGKSPKRNRIWPLSFAHSHQRLVRMALFRPLDRHLLPDPEQAAIALRSLCLQGLSCAPGAPLTCALVCTPRSVAV